MAITSSIPISSGTATRRAKAKGSVSVSFAHMSVTAATGDMVRPAAAPSDTTAPTSIGSASAENDG
jgi:hypothetical protein